MKNFLFFPAGVIFTEQHKLWYPRKFE